MLLNRSYPIAAGMFAVLCWASLPVVMKLGLEDLPLTYFLFLRFAVASAFCLAITRVDLSKRLDLGWRRWLGLAVLLAANFVLQTFAIHEIPATWYIAIFSLSPLLSLLVLRTRLTVLSVCGIALALGGTLLFALSSGQFAGLSNGGLLALVGGMVTWTLYVPAIKPFQEVFSDREVTAITSVLSLISVTPIWLSEGMPNAQLSFHGYLAIGLLGLIVPLAYWAFLYAVRQVPVFGISSQYLEPVFGCAFAAVILGETLTAWQVTGGLVILSGVALIRTE